MSGCRGGYGPHSKGWYSQQREPPTRHSVFLHRLPFLPTVVSIHSSPIRLSLPASISHPPILLLMVHPCLLADFEVEASHM